MKIVCLLLVAVVVTLDAASTTPDYRELYDRLLIELINERIRQAEQYLIRVNTDIKKYQETKDEELRVNINKEIDFILPLIKEGNKILTEELKKPGLDLLEKYITEKAKLETDLFVKLFTEAQASVKKYLVFYAATTAPDYRSEYDRLLAEQIQEQITRADGQLLALTYQLDEYLKTKNAELKSRIIAEVELTLPFLKQFGDQAATQLKRTDLNYLEKFLFEKQKDQTDLLIKHYTSIETAVNKAYFDYEVPVVPGATTAPVDWRSEYDRLLFQLVEENVRRADGLLIQLQRQYNEYLTTKDKAIVDLVEREVEFTLPFVKQAADRAATELKRTDLNTIEHYLFSKIADEAQLLVKYYTQIETQIKAIKTF